MLFEAGVANTVFDCRDHVREVFQVTIPKVPLCFNHMQPGEKPRQHCGAQEAPHKHAAL